MLSKGRLKKFQPGLLMSLLAAGYVPEVEILKTGYQRVFLLRSPVSS